MLIRNKPAIKGVGAPQSIVSSVAEAGSDVVHETTLTLAGTMTITRAGAGDDGYGGVKLYEFPKGRILILGVVVDLTVDVSASANIANAGSGDFSMGTAITANTTLSGPNVTLCPKTTMTDPFGDGALDAGVGDAEGYLTIGAQFGDLVTTIAAWLNMIFDAGDVTTGNGEAVLAGTVTINWMKLDQ